TGPMVELRIADTGPGIPTNIVDRIFDPFFTTKKDGTGLGLAISRRILTAHKGGIWVESYPGAGTVFTLRVPASSGGSPS
ncbi:MAG TPA: ATP-binding protein, partial [Anaerolineales bacterium]